MFPSGIRDVDNLSEIWTLKKTKSLKGLLPVVLAEKN